MIEFPYCVYPALKKVFCERQYTRRQLADAVGISKSNVWWWLSGNNQHTIDVIKGILREKRPDFRGSVWRCGMKVGDKVRAQFMTVPEEFPGKARGEKLYPIRTGVVTHIHPQRRYVTVAIMVDGKEIKESFRPEEVLA